MSAEQIGALAALLTALAGVLTVVLVQARRVHIEDREQLRKEHADELAAIREQTAYAQEQLTPNHGSSTRDAINRADEATREIADRMQHNSEQIAAVGSKVADLAETIKSGFARMDKQFDQVHDRQMQLGETVSSNDSKADRAHSEIFRRLHNIEGGK